MFAQRADTLAQVGTVWLPLELPWLPLFPPGTSIGGKTLSRHGVQILETLRALELQLRTVALAV